VIVLVNGLGLKSSPCVLELLWLLELLELELDWRLEFELYLDEEIKPDLMTTEPFESGAEVMKMTGPGAPSLVLASDMEVARRKVDDVVFISNCETCVLLAERMIAAPVDTVGGCDDDEGEDEPLPSDRLRCGWKSIGICCMLLVACEGGDVPMEELRRRR
jgi:hypothetical protein